MQKGKLGAEHQRNSPVLAAQFNNPAWNGWEGWPWVGPDRCWRVCRMERQPWPVSLARAQLAPARHTWHQRGTHELASCQPWLNI